MVSRSPQIWLLYVPSVSCKPPYRKRDNFWRLTSKKKAHGWAHEFELLLVQSEALFARSCANAATALTHSRAQDEICQTFERSAVSSMDVG